MNSQMAEKYIDICEFLFEAVFSTGPDFILCIGFRLCPPTLSL